MRIKTGETVTITTNLLLEYTCSNCGKETKGLGTVVTTGYTPTVLGIKTNKGYVSEASEEMHYKLKELLEYNNDTRYSDKHFSCRCRNCGYREPWARMYFSVSSILLLFSWIALIISGICMLLHVFGQIWSAAGILAVVLVVCIAALIWIKQYQGKHTYKMECLIPKLPKTAIPRISVITTSGTRIPLEFMFKVSEKKSNI